MIKLEKPQIKQGDIVEDCIGNIKDEAKKQRLKAAEEEIIESGKSYDELGEKGQLSTLEKKEIVQSGAGKEELIFLYDKKMSRKGEKARKYYDQLILSAPNGRCPQCGQRQVRTLDHYLPKSQYPLLAVVPYNLIPCCSDCNKDKLAESPDSRELETIHPYYDTFDDAVWIKVEVIEEEPVAFHFYVCRPDTWTNEKYNRAKNHFEVFKLNELYKPCASEMFTTEIHWIHRLFQRCGEEIARQEILERMQDEQKTRMNTWKAAVYEALYRSE